MNNPKDISPNNSVSSRRNFLKLAGPFALFLSCPAYAFDLFKIIDPDGQNSDIQKAKQALEGLTGIVQSAEGIDYKSEFTIGETLALEGFQRYGLPVKNKKLQTYVNTLGNAVAQNSMRPDITYYFVVVDTPIYNAFSCPGGIVFVSGSLVKGMNDESELACVLSHEVAHVAHKHALSSVRRAKFFESAAKIGTINMKGDQGKQYQEMVGGLQTMLFDKGLDKGMEYEADESAMAVAYRTGYDPNGLIRVLKMLQQKEATATSKGSWFSTHPPLSSRLEKCYQWQKKYPDAAQMATVVTRFQSYRKML
ncbi:MAG: M48 family metalloprotease [Desulfobacteraceae bacterium]|nr:M48 family metalloprotease [Desulfobacteraceae bacterium]MBC2756469.1 M48 family metalloprotease [Desulfobacteraceae bacterium]